MFGKYARNFSIYLALLIINGLLMAGAPASAKSKVESPLREPTAGEQAATQAIDNLKFVKAQKPLK